MEEKSKKKKIINILICVLLIITFVMIGVIACLFVNHFSNKNEKINTTQSIEVISSVGNTIQVGDTGSILAILKEGEMIKENVEFDYSVSDKEILSIEGNTFTGLKEGNAIIEVYKKSSKDVKKDFKITVLEADFSVYLNYPELGESEWRPHKANIEWDNKNKKFITVLPQLNYGFEYKWIDEAGNEYILDENGNEQISGTAIEINYDMNLMVEFEPKKIAFEGYNNLAYNTMEVRYGEKIDLTKFPYPQKVGWRFEGWYPDINKDEYKNGLNEDGEFFLTTNTLYAKWTREISFEVPNIKPINKGDLKNETLLTITVTYATMINDETLKNLEYSNGEHVGWYTEKNGSGSKLDLDAIFTLDNSNRFYNCVAFPLKVIYHDSNAEEKTEILKQIYGKSLKESKSILNYENNVLPTPIQNYNGWNLIINKWSFVEGNDLDKYLYDAEIPFADELVSGNTTIYELRTTTYIFYNELGENGKALDSPKITNKANIIYKSNMDFANPDNYLEGFNFGGWKFEGWYQFDGDYNKAFDDTREISTSLENNFHFRAKWTSNISFKVPKIKPINKGVLESAILFETKMTYASLFNYTILEDLDYADNGEHIGWYTGENGSGNKLNLNEKFMFTEAKEFYNCVAFPLIVKYHDSNVEEKTEVLKQIYGKCLRESKNILNNENNVLPTPIQNYNGWYLINNKWSFIEGNDNEQNLYSVETVYTDKLVTGSATIYELRSTTYTFYNELGVDGESLKTEPNRTEVENIIYKSGINFSAPENYIEGITFGGWKFEGWYQFDGNTDNVFDDTIEISTILENGFNFRAKWTSVISFNIDTRLASIDKTSLNVIYNGKVDCPSLTYLGQGKDTGDIKFDGWYSQLYGEGEKLNPNRYTFNKSGLTFYDKTLINVHFIDELNKSTYEPVTVIYGKTFAESCEIDNTGGIIPVLSDSIWDHIGWEYKTRSSKLEIISNVEGHFVNLLKDIRYFFTEDNPQFSGSITLSAVWEISVNFSANKGRIEGKDSIEKLRYGNVLRLPQMQCGSWNVSGWYIDDSTYNINVNEKNNDISSTSDYFTNLIKNYCSNGVLRLYAKWSNKVVLDYGKIIDESNQSITVTYGIPMNDTLPTEIGDKIGYDNPKNNFWKTQDGETVNPTTINYPLIMDCLIYQWESNYYLVTFKEYRDGGIRHIGEEKIYYDSKIDLPSKYCRENNGWGPFLGYSYFENVDDTLNDEIGRNPIDGVQYFNHNGNAVRSWDKAYEVTLYAIFGESFSITLDSNEGTSSKRINVGGLVWGKNNELNESLPTKTGYDLIGFFTEKDPSKQNSENKYYEYNKENKNLKSVKIWENKDWENISDIILYAGWEPSSYKVIFHPEGGEVDSKYIENPITVTYGTVFGDLPNPTKPKPSDQYQKYVNAWWRTFEVRYSFAGWFTESTGGTQITKNSRVESTGDIHLYAHWNSTTIEVCVVEGSLITLADGSQKRVEELTGNELLLVWNIYTGKFDVAPILFIDSDPKVEYEIINLYFSDGTISKIIFEHGFWDYNLNEWVFLRNDAEKYIGHWFSKQSLDTFGNLIMDKVQLTNVVITKEVTTAWSPVTYGHLCYYVNGILSMPGATEGFINIFEVDYKTLKVNEKKMLDDIEKYGLFTYEDFSEYIPEEIFNAFNGQYLKVAMGKGLLTWEDIFILIDKYQKFWE